MAYLATSGAGADRSQVVSAGDRPKGTNVLSMPSETARVDGTKTYDYVTVYTKSALVEQTTPDSLNLASDTASSVSSIAFVDKDLDATNYGGTVTWTAPSLHSHVTHYVAYLATSGAGADRSQVVSAGDRPKGTNVLSMPSETGWKDGTKT